MLKNNYLYFFIYDNTESDLCKLESNYIFNQKEKNKLLLSDKKIEPSISAFIQKRMDILLQADDYSTLITKIKNEKICIDNFKVEYIVLDGDTTEYSKRLEKLKDIGYSINGTPEYYKPAITYALCHYKSVWYFGTLTRNNLEWQKHKQKPFSYSNSININIAKALVNIATQTNTERKILDTCCGVGTIMLEACFAGNTIEGCDINWKVCRQARTNLSHFNYTANVYRSDIKDIANIYDAAIIDLPYNIFSNPGDDTTQHIIESTTKIADRIIIVSITDIREIITNAGLIVSDYCTVKKSGKAKFARSIWICEKKESDLGGTLNMEVIDKKD